jgi:hypothetical protein
MRRRYRRPPGTFVPDIGPHVPKTRSAPCPWYPPRMKHQRRRALSLVLLIGCGDAAGGESASAGSTSEDQSQTSSASSTATATSSATSGGTTSGGTTSGGTTSGGATSGGTTMTTEGEETDADGEPCEPPPAAGPGSWSSLRVYPGADGYLVYETDKNGDRIPDFGAAGYRRGLAPLPDVAAALTLGPSGGDDTAAIQAALDEVAALPLDREGRRGALVLEPGEYTIAGTLRIAASGVVLRGAGDGGDPAANTILRIVGDTPAQREALIVGNDKDDRWKPELPGTRSDVVSELVPVAADTLEVAEPGNFAVGDHVVIVHPCTDAWLAAVDYGATASDAPWAEGSQPLVFKRQIVAIDGATLHLDAPLFNALDRALAQSYVYVHDRAGVVTEVGIEDLRIDIQTKGGTDEEHAWTAIALRGLEDAWVRRVTALHFGFSGVLIATGVQITVDDVRALDPVAQIVGGNMYNFNASGAQQALFTRCEARGGRHHYVSNGTSWTSGVVFHRSTSEGANAPSEGHRRWSMGLLYDNVVDKDPVDDVVLGLHNRGDYGTGHGWASAHSVAWNYDLGGAAAIIQRPPTAQNYAIGGAGLFSGTKPPAPFDQPEGYIEGIGEPGLFPESLYEQQLAERRCPPRAGEGR